MLIPKKLSPHRKSSFGKMAEKLGREAVIQAIADHKKAGHPIYFSNDKDQMIKELPDGSQFVIKVALDGTETIEKQIR